MKNIHLLTTDKDALDFPFIAKNCFTNNYTIVNSTFKDNCELTGINIYITSDEKFVRDEYITDGIEVIKASPKLVDAQGLVNRRNWRKIILTTDQDLIVDGVQAIPDEFLEWFVKNPSCENADVNDWLDTNSNIAFGGDKRYQICNHLHDKKIIPKEEPNLDKHLASLPEYPGPRRSAFISKQETLEEAAEKYDENNTNDEYGKSYRAFIEGAKWQQERSYSEEDLMDFGAFIRIEDRKEKRLFLIQDYFKVWFNQFKKK